MKNSNMEYVISIVSHFNQSLVDADISIIEAYSSKK